MDDLINLANGCVCCQIRDDLMKAVDSLLAREEPVEYFLLEASGVADPASIALTFSDPKYRDRIRLDSVTCVVDADQVFANPDDETLAMLKLQQLAFSDLVILNEVDLAGEDAVAMVKAWIDKHIKRIRIVEAEYCNVPYEILLSVGRFDPVTQLERQEGGAMGAEHGHEHDHHDSCHEEVDKVLGKQVDAGKTFGTWSLETDKPMSLGALKAMARKLPGNI